MRPNLAALRRVIHASGGFGQRVAEVSIVSKLQRVTLGPRGEYEERTNPLLINSGFEVDLGNMFLRHLSTPRYLTELIWLLAGASDAAGRMVTKPCCFDYFASLKSE